MIHYLHIYYKYSTSRSKVITAAALFLKKFFPLVPYEVNQQNALPFLTGTVPYEYRTVSGKGFVRKDG